MIRAAEFRHALTGLGRLLRFDESGIDYFDLTRAGALRSFWLGVYLAPLGVLLLHADLNRATDGAVPLGEPSHFAAFLLFHILDWMLFPVIIWHLVSAAKNTTRYPAFICLYNWLQLPLYLIFGFGLLLEHMLGPENPLVQLVSIAGIYFMVLLFFIARRSVAQSLPMALSVLGLFVIAWVMFTITVTFTFPETLALILEQSRRG